MSARLSRRERRLLFAYEDELSGHCRGRALALQLGALAAFLLWLRRRSVQLGEAWPQDLVAWRGVLGAQRRGNGRRPAARRFEAVRGLYRFLYCQGLLRHDPGAGLELPPRPSKKR